MSWSSEYDDGCFFIILEGRCMGKIRVDIVGAGLLFAALMLLVKGVPGAKEAVSLAMAQGILWGAVFVGACMVVLQLWRKSYPSLAEDRECACVGFGAVFVAAAAIVAWTGLVPPFAPGVLAGASFSLMGAIWVKECARYAMDDVLLSSSVGLVRALRSSRRRPCFPRNGISWPFLFWSVLPRCLFALLVRMRLFRRRRSRTMNPMPRRP